MGVSVWKDVGLRIRDENDALFFLDDGRLAPVWAAVEEAGVFSMVLEVIPGVVAKRITEAVSVPTIGIGAGQECDGEIQVWHDVLGLSTETYKHAKRFLEGNELIIEALTAYAEAVRNREFPAEENTF